MQIFTTDLNEIEGRIDPHYYLPKFRDLVASICKVPHESLNSLVEFSNQTWDQKSIYEDTFPYIEISQIDTTTGEIKNCEEIKVSEAPSRAKMIVKSGDIIVSTTRPHRGAISYLKDKYDNYIASTGFAILRYLKKSSISKDCLFYIMRSELILAQMLQRSSGGNYPAIATEELKNVIIPIPNFETQKRIVNLMESAYQLKRLKEKEAQELLDSINIYILYEIGIQVPEIKKEMIYKLDSDEIMHRRIDVEYYQNYFNSFVEQISDCKFQKKRLGEITEFIENGRTPPKEHYAESENNAKPIIKVSTASKKIVDLSKVEYVKSDFIGSKIVKVGDIFILSAAHQAEYVGKNVSYLAQQPPTDTYYVGELIGIRSRQNLCLPMYLFGFLSTKLAYILLNREKRGQTSHLYPDDIRKINIPVPPMQTQQTIVNEIQSRREKAESLQREANESLQAAKKQVEEMLFT